MPNETPERRAESPDSAATGIRPDEIRGTTVLGFARWLERGAKPEFPGITRLSATAEDIAERRRHLTSDERRYTGGTLTMPVDVPNLGQDLRNGTDLLAAPTLPQRIKEDGSLPSCWPSRRRASSRRRVGPSCAGWVRAGRGAWGRCGKFDRQG